MIKYIYINNYKNLVNYKIQFNPISFLIGKNGCGKSNVFEVIGRLCSFLYDDVQDIDKLFPYSSLTRWMKSNIQTFEICLLESNKEYIYKLELEHNDQTRQCHILSEKLYIDGKSYLFAKDGSVSVNDDKSEATLYFTAGHDYSNIRLFANNEKFKSIYDFISLIRRIVICSPNPKVMLSAVKNDDVMPENDFANIGSICANLFQTTPESFVNLGNVLKEINPGYVQAKIVSGQYNKRLSIEYRFKDVKCIFDFEELSDGEKALFAIYLLIYAYLKKGYTLLLDEPDNFVSLREIQAICMSIEEAVGEAGQCLLISHNADVINYFTDQAGIWFDRNTSGESKIIDNPYKANQEQILTYSEFISRGIGEMDEA